MRDLRRTPDLADHRPDHCRRLSRPALLAGAGPPRGQHLHLEPGAGRPAGAEEPAAQRAGHLDLVADDPAADAAPAAGAPGGAVDPVRRSAPTRTSSASGPAAPTAGTS